MVSSRSEVCGGTTPYMAPELLLPSKFGLAACTPSKAADVYAFGMVIYEVGTVLTPTYTYQSFPCRCSLEPHRLLNCPRPRY